jgi:hypothetical protein
MQLRLALNSQFSCLNLPSAGITGVCLHIWLPIFFWLEFVQCNYSLLIFCVFLKMYFLINRIIAGF